MVAYASKSLTQAERNYSTTEGECLAVVWGVKHFRPYLFGTKFSLVTDHASLKWLMNSQDLNTRLMRWSLKLQEYDFEIEYRPGKQHTDVDALSRFPPALPQVRVRKRGNQRENEESSAASQPLFSGLALLASRSVDEDVSNFRGEELDKGLEDLPMLGLQNGVIAVEPEIAETENLEVHIDMESFQKEFEVEREEETPQWEPWNEDEPSQGGSNQEN